MRRLTILWFLLTLLSGTAAAQDFEVAAEWSESLVELDLEDNEVTGVDSEDQKEEREEQNDLLLERYGVGIEGDDEGALHQLDESSLLDYDPDQFDRDEELDDELSEEEINALDAFEFDEDIEEDFDEEMEDMEDFDDMDEMNEAAFEGDEFENEGFEDDHFEGEFDEEGFDEEDFEDDDFEDDGYDESE